MMNQILISLPETEFWERHRGILREELTSLLILKPSPPEEEPLLKIGEIADDLNVTRQTIHDWKRKGLIPYERVGSRVFFRKSQVRAALKKIEAIKFK
jgi:excisionase family DNA binding protein